MTLTELVPLLLKASIVLTVFGFALNSTLADATYLFRYPGKWLRALLSMNVILPVVAALLAGLFDLHPAVKIALGALAVSPIPPILPTKIFRAGGRESYTLGLLVATALVSIVLVPLTLEVLRRTFAIPVGMPISAVALIVLTTILAPLGAGVLIHAVAPRLARSMARPVSLFATVLLILSALPVLVAALPPTWALVGNGSILALLAFVTAGLVAGHLIGGPDSGERMVLALSTASRHPGVALAIAHASFPQQTLAMAAVLLYLLVGAVASAVYLKWFGSRYSLG